MDLSSLKEMQKQEIQKGHHNTNGDIYVYNDKVYKILEQPILFEDEVKRNICYLMKCRIPHTAIIYDTLEKNGRFVGYEMEYIKDAYTFREAINMDFPIMYKLNAIYDIHEALRYLHDRNIYLGDIH